MAPLQCTDVQGRSTEFLDLTSVTFEEFQQLVPPCEAAFQAHMAMRRLDGKPRTARQFGLHWCFEKRKNSLHCLDSNGVSVTVDVCVDGNRRQEKESPYEEHRTRPGEDRYA